MIYRLSQLRNFLDRIEKFNLPYKTIEYGTTSIVLWGDKRRDVFVGQVGDPRLQGLHVINMLKRHVIKNFENFTFKYTTDINDGNIITTWYCQRVLEKLVKKEICIMDINSCYFETLNILGYCSPKVYESANKLKEEYKDARNKAIGSLGRNQYVTEVDEKQNRKSYMVWGDERLKLVRRNVIRHVYDVSEAIFKKFPNDIFMFQTDCFYFERHIKDDIEQELKKFGYTVKHWKGDLFDWEDNGGGSITIYIYDYKEEKIKQYRMPIRNDINPDLDYAKNESYIRFLEKKYGR